MTTEKNKAALDACIGIKGKTISKTQEYYIEIGRALHRHLEAIEQALTAQAEAQDENHADNVSIDFGDLVGEIRSYFEPRPIPNGIQYGIDRVYAAIRYEASQAEAQPAEDEVRSAREEIEAYKNNKDFDFIDSSRLGKNQMRALNKAIETLIRAATAPKTTDAETVTVEDNVREAVKEVETWLCRLEKNDNINALQLFQWDSGAIRTLIRAATRAPAAVPRDGYCNSWSWQSKYRLIKQRQSKAEEIIKRIAYKPIGGKTDDYIFSVNLQNMAREALSLLGGKEG